MNQNTIVNFELGGKKGLFVSIPYKFKKFVTHHYDGEGTFLVENDTKNFNPNWELKIPEAEYKFIGRSNELSPELIKDNFDVDFKQYIKILNELDVTVDYSDHSNFWAVLLTER